MKHITLASFLICLGAGSGAADGAATQEIDQHVWAVVSRTVLENDIEGMAAVYHPDAVLVSGRGTVPISEQLAKWGRDMEESKRQGASASVAFRFSSRQNGETTAFESGMFNYTVTASSGGKTSYFIPFEGLLVKKGGKWLILMERQLEAADEAAWAALAAR